MREVDLTRVRDLVGQIQDAQRRLNILAKIPEEEFLADFRNTESAKYLLMVAIEAAIDICNHIVARQGGRAPQDYADCMTVLSEMGIIPSDLCERLRKMARFRNLLVHLYWQVDNHIVFRILKEEIQDLDDYVLNILEYLEL